jgi:hypothetical protein
MNKLKTGLLIAGLYTAGCMASWIHTYETEIKPLEKQFDARVQTISEQVDVEQYRKSETKDAKLSEIIQQRNDVVKGEAIDLSWWRIKYPTKDTMVSQTDSFHLHYNPLGFLF